jgi:hypothetical protein
MSLHLMSESCPRATSPVRSIVLNMPKQGLLQGFVNAPGARIKQNYKPNRCFFHQMMRPLCGISLGEAARRLRIVNLKDYFVLLESHSRFPVMKINRDCGSGSMSNVHATQK